MDDHCEEKIRVRAYELWERGGAPAIPRITGVRQSAN